MASSDKSKIAENYNIVNNDYLGLRHVEDSQELVSYYANTSHRIWLNDLTAKYDTHWHSALEIINPVENYYDAVVGGVEYRIQPGDIFIIPPRELHSLIAPPQGKRFIFIMNISAISMLKGYAGIQSILTHPLHITRDTYPLIYDDIYQILVQIRNEYYKNSEYAELSIHALLVNLLVKIGENHNNADELFPNVRLYKQKEYVQKFNQILEYIDDHYMEDISLEGVAYTAGFSKYHFSRLFKQYTDFTFCDYLCYRRIKAAEEFLAQPDLSITEVALQAGFPSISTFNRLFKQQKGITPSEFRSKRTVAKRVHPGT